MAPSVSKFLSPILYLAAAVALSSCTFKMAGTTLSAARQGNGGRVNPVKVVLPTITSFSPADEYFGATITIVGTKFTRATAIKIGSTDCASFIVLSDTSATCVIAKGSVSGTLKVTTASGSAVSASSLLVYPAAINSIHPVNSVTGWGYGYNVRPLLIPNGRVLLSGTAGFHPAIGCLEADGSACANFGAAGVLTIASSTVLGINSIFHTADGKVLLGAGDYAYRPENPSALIRLSEGGALDGTFGSAGQTSFAGIATGEIMRSVVVKADGTIYAHTIGPVGSGGGDGNAIKAYDSSGNPLNSFGTASVSEIDENVLGSNHYYTDVPNRSLALLAADNTLLVAGQQSGKLGLVKMDAAGVVSPSFAVASQLNDGSVVTKSSGTPLILAGKTSTGIRLEGYSAAGVSDDAFGTHGATDVAMDNIHLTDVVYATAQNKIYMTGSTGVYPIYQIFVVRFNGDGTLDTTYSRNGIYRYQPVG